MQALFRAFRTLLPFTVPPFPSLEWPRKTKDWPRAPSKIIVVHLKLVSKLPKMCLIRNELSSYFKKKEI